METEEPIKEGIKYSKKDELTKEEIKFWKEWKKRASHICKPCWELKYCPYGPLVEQFPVLGPTRKEAIEHNEFLRKQLAKGAYKGLRKKVFEEEVKEFNARDYPENYPRETLERACSIFGHLCPVFFVNEPFTETTKMRRISRHIPREIMLRVIRRDNYTCQICGKHLRDHELEFDHIIPFSKGGSTEESNLQLVCSDCNHSKGVKLPSFVQNSKKDEHEGTQIDVIE